MTTGTWGSFIFSVDVNRIIPISDFTRKTSYKTETKESGKNKPLTIDKGPDLSTISFKIQLMAFLGVDVDKEAAKWHEACESGKPYPLVIGGVKQGKHQWQLKDVTESSVTYDPEVKKMTATLQINFTEYRGAGSGASTTSTASSNRSRSSSKPPTTPVNTVPNAINTTPITQRPPSVNPTRSSVPANAGRM